MSIEILTFKVPFFNTISAFNTLKCEGLNGQNVISGTEENSHFENCDHLNKANEQ